MQVTVNGMARRIVWGAMPVLLLLASMASGQADNPDVRFYQIPAGPLAPALNRFALEAGVVLYFDPALATDKTTGGIKGVYSVQEGFQVLLVGTSLSVRREDDGGFAVVDPAEGGGRLSTITVQAALDPRGGMYQKAGSSSVVTRADIDRLPGRNTSDVLAEIPGLTTSQSRQDPGVSINIRGLQDFGRVNMMVDGTRQNYQQSGHGSNGQAYLDPELLAGVDVAKGPSSTAGGAGVIGGVVNFRTLDFQDLVEPGERAGGRINLTSGSNAYHFSGSVAGAAQLTDNLEVVAAISRKNVGAFEKGERGGNDGGYWHGTSQFTGQQQWSALFKSTVRFADDHALKFSYIGMDADFDKGSNTALNTAATDNNKVRSDTVKLGYTWQPNSDWLDLDSSLYLTRTGNDQYRSESGSASDPYGAFAVRYETNTLGGTLTNRSYLPLQHIDGTLDLNYGAEFYQDWTRPEAEQTSGGDGDPSWFSGPTPEGDRIVASVFAQAQLAHNSGLGLSAGLRYDYFSLEGKGEMYVGSIQNPPGTRPPRTSLYTEFDVARHDGFVSPTAMASYQLTNALQVFASYAEGVRPPAITETLMWGSHVGNTFPFFPNPGLEPEESRTWEVGANWTRRSVIADGDHLRFKTAWFDNKVNNYITQAPIMGPAATTSSSMSLAFVNLQDEVRFRGFEFQGEYDTGFAFLRATWTHLLQDLGRGGYDPYPLGSIVGYPASTHGQPNGGGTWYILPPPKNGTFSAGLRFFDQRLELGGRARYQNNDGRGGTSYEDVVDWTVYDIWASYEATDDLTLRVGVDNLRDYNYAELNGLSYWIAPGRTVTGTLSLKF